MSRRKLPKWLTKAEMKQLLAVPNTRYKTPHRNLCIIRVMLDAGLRASEVVSLRPEHVNMMSGRVIVRGGKGDKDRETYISTATRDLIADYMERRPASEWLFPTHNGTRIKTAYLREMVKRYACEANIPECEKVSPHTLRHTFATHYYRQTKDLVGLQQLLGHADISTTRIYTQMGNGDIERSVSQFHEDYY